MKAVAKHVGSKIDILFVVRRFSIVQVTYMYTQALMYTAI